MRWNGQHAAILLLAALMSGSKIMAADANDGSPTLFVHASDGYSIYKSSLVASNDTSTTLSYGIGAWAGAGHNIGLALERETTDVAFKLNAASIALQWQDAVLRYRFGPLHLGVLVSNSAWTVKAPPSSGAAAANLIDVTTSNYGAEAGVFIPMEKRGSIHLDIDYVEGAAARQNAADAPSPAHVTTLGPRMDIDLGGAIGLTKLISAECGFKYRTYVLIVDAKSDAEQLNTTYVGLVGGFQF